MNLQQRWERTKVDTKRRYGAVRSERLRHWRPKPLDPESRPGGRPLVVSLTSYQPRLATVPIAIKSLMKQTVRPSQIVLYLDDSVTDAQIPSALQDLTSYGLRISRGHENYRSHKKYRFAFEEFPDSNVVLADDDLLYAPDTLESLVNGAAKHPGAVVGRRAHRITFDDLGAPLPYEQWLKEQRCLDEGACRPFMLTTGAGTLFPPETHQAFLHDFSLAMELAPAADDLWLKAQATLQDVPLVSLEPDWFALPPTIPSTQESGLFRQGNAFGGNDEALARIMEHYGMTGKDFGAPV